MIEIVRIENRPVSSNCFLISNKKSNSTIIVDPGTEDCKELLSILKVKNLIPEYIILTHEHIDHIIGCEELLKHYNAKIVCSSDCNSHLNSLKYNLTGFSDKFEERTSIPNADILLEEINYSLRWDNIEIKFDKAEGHSLGSIIFTIGDNLFAGDTLIKGFKTITSLPGGSKEKLLLTFKNIFIRYNPIKTKVYSGHDESFYLGELEVQINEQIDFIKKRLNKISIIHSDTPQS